MKKIYSLTIILCGLLCPSLQNCPHCVGKVTEQTPPFFTDECYEDIPIESVDATQTHELSLLEKIDKEKQ